MNGPAGMTSTERKRSPRSFGSNVVISSSSNNQTGQNNQNTNRKVYRDTKAEEERNEGSYLDTMMPGGNITYREMNEGRARTAYEASVARQEQMQKARDMAYNIVDGQQQSNFQNLSDSQKQQLIDSGFAAAESSGVLGGTFGAELVSNQIKQQIQNATNQEEFDAAIAAMDRLTGDIKITDQMGAMGLLSFDPSAVFSFGDVESNPQLYQAYQDMASKNLTPQQYTNYMNQIPAFGHQRMSSGMGGGSGGFNYGYGSGSGGGGGFGYNMNMGMQGQPKQRAQIGPGGLQEQVNQAFLSGGKPFAKGGIVSLVED
jgi:hypothetical protein